MRTKKLLKRLKKARRLRPRKKRKSVYLVTHFQSEAHYQNRSKTRYDECADAIGAIFLPIVNGSGQ